MKKVSAFLSLALAVSAPALAAKLPPLPPPSVPVERHADIILYGDVKDVIAITTSAVSLTGSSTSTVTYLDLRTATAGTDVFGNTIYQVTRVNCSAFLSACQSLVIGDTVKVVAEFSGISPGSTVTATPMHIVGFDYQ